jgi:hypothetical protein
MNWGRCQNLRNRMFVAALLHNMFPTTSENISFLFWKFLFAAQRMMSFIARNHENKNVYNIYDLKCLPKFFYIVVLKCTTWLLLIRALPFPIKALDWSFILNWNVWYVFRIAISSCICIYTEPVEVLGTQYTFSMAQREINSVLHARSVTFVTLLPVSYIYIYIWALKS